MPLPGLVALATLGALVVAALVMLFGYINRDVQRRGMSPTLWTLLAIFVPNAIGIVLYFLLREPRPYKCPQCETTVSARFNFCPNCKYNLHPTCPQCKHKIHTGDHYCPHCASDLTEAGRE